jgi:alkylation response protein AidB-like acyl-CoA dehydrogenase
MDFDDTPEEATFRSKARAWVAANAPKTHTGDVIRDSKAWQKKKYEAGWACLDWPKAFGGRGATPIERVIWRQEEGWFGTLSDIFVIGHGMCGPTLMAYASEEQKRRYLPPLAAGEEIWCQLFSEPSSGSDLAGLRTRAVKDGDDWIVNGQKIWTSGAQFSDYGILLTRTDPALPKHAGLTMFFVSMHSEGIEVRPIRQANGEASFNEVFFTNVRIPDAQRLGAVNAGWNTALTTLMNERLTIASGGSSVIDDIFNFCREIETPNGRAIEDPAVRSKLAGWAVKSSGLKYTSYRSQSALSRGERPGPESSIGKLVMASMVQDIAMFALDLQAQSGIITDRSLAAASGRFQAMLLRSAAMRIEGGTDEIMRNILGERVLGLPPDIRADKGIPFHQIPTSPNTTRHPGLAPIVPAIVPGPVPPYL